MDREGWPRVLVIEDDLGQRIVTADALRRHWKDAVVRTAETGLTARVKLRDDAPDLVVADVNLPDCDGLELCREIRRELRLEGTRLLVLTGMADRDTLERARDAGADCVLAKPVALEALRAAAMGLLGPAPA